MHKKTVLHRFRGWNQKSKVEKLSKLERKIGMANHSCSTYVSQPSITLATRDLGLWLNLENSLYL